MLIGTLLVLMALFLAYANGANDNFKGVATLYGCNAVSYKSAITLATIATFAGSVSSIFVAAALVKVFSGKGVVPDHVAASTTFLAAVAAGAAGTVMLATMLGFPISTTHGLIGGIVGAGFIATGGDLNLKVLGSSFLAPLLGAPLLAICLTAPLFIGLTWLKKRLAINRKTCVCIGAAQVVPVYAALSSHPALRPAIALETNADPGILISAETDCLVRSHGQLFVAPLQRLIDCAHGASAATVSFARGVNDTPKMVALLAVLQAFDVQFSLLAISVAIAIGGLLSAKRVANTMSKRISHMDDASALAANLVTAVLVIGASPMGLPVSTTHVSVGAVTGVGLINGTADTKVISSILLSWLITLPVAATLGGAVYAVAQYFV
jgi:inorganic phosphate transporter, PiT family